MLLAAVLGPLALAAPGAGESTGPWLRIETGEHEADINALALLDGGRTVVTVSDDKTARLWSADRLAPIDVLRPPLGPSDQGALYAVAATGDLIAVGGRIGTPGNYGLALFKRGGAGAAPASVKPNGAAPPPTARALGTITGLPHEISALRFSPAGNLLAVGLQGAGGLRLFDIKALAQLPGDAGYGGAVRGIDFDAQGRIATSSDDGKVRLYSADGAHPTLVALPPGARPWGVSFSPDGRLLAVGDRVRPIVWLIDAAAQRMVRELDGAPGRVGGLFAVAFGPDGADVVAAGSYNDPATHQYFARSFRVAGRAAVEKVIATNTVTALALLPDGMVFATDEPSIGRTDTTGSVSVRRVAHHIDFRDAGLASFRLSPDGSKIELPARRSDGRHIVFDLAARVLTLEEAGPDFIPPMPQAAGLAATDWHGSAAPRLNGRVVRLDASENARSVAVAPGGGAAVLGTDFFVRYVTPAGQVWRQVADAPAWAVNVSADGKRVVAGLGDGTVHWYSAATGEPLASLFIDPGTGRWVLWTPEGFFDHDHPTDGSADGRTLIGYAQNRPDGRAADYIQIGQLYPSFFRPDMVGLAFLDTPDARAAVQAQRDRIGPVRTVLSKGLPPSLSVIDFCGHEAGSLATGCPDDPGARALDQRNASGVLETTGDQVLIDYKLQAPASARSVGEAVLRRNQAVIAPPAFTLEEEDRSRTQEAAVALGMGMNVIRLTPVAASGQVEGSQDHSVELRVLRKPAAAAPAAGAPRPEERQAGPAQAPATPPPPEEGGKPRVTLYVLSVGVSHFKRSELNLDNATNDASAVASLFNGSDAPVYDRAVVTTLLDDQATGANITAALHDIAKHAGPDDLVVLFFAGHGQEVDGKYYYAPVDFGMRDADLFRRALAPRTGHDDPLDELFRREGYGQAEMLPAIQGIQAARVALILDTCFSASIATEDAVIRHDTNSTVTNAIGHASGRFVLSSATALALDSAGTPGALPSDQEGHGLFTSFLLRALRGEADTDKTGRIDVYKLTMFTTHGVERASKSLRQAQQPSYFLNGQFFDLRAVAVN